MRFSEAYSPGTAIGAGWDALKRAPLPLIVGCVLLATAQSHCGIESDDFRDLPRWAWDFLGLAILSGGIFSVLLFALQVFVTPGYYRVAGRAIFGQRPAFERLFGSGDRFLDLLLWELLRGALLVLSALTLALPLLPLGLFGSVAAIFGSGRWDNWDGIGLVFGVLAFLYVFFFALPVFLYVELGLYFGRFIVSLEGKGPGEALRTSWGLASGNRLWLFFYRAVMFLVAAAGVFALFIGYFVTRAITDAGAVGAFLSLRRGGWPEVNDRGPTRPASPAPPTTPAPPTAPTSPAPPTTPVPPTSPTEPVPPTAPAPPTAPTPGSPKPRQSPRSSEDAPRSRPDGEIDS